MIHWTTKIDQEVDICDHDTIPKKTIVEKFKEVVAKHGNRIALCHKLSDQWTKMTYTEYYITARLVAMGFIQFGLQSGDGVGIMGFNSPEWHISNMAAIMSGGVS